MLNITDNAKEQRIVPLFRLGFRPLFLLGSAFSALAILAYMLMLTGKVSFSPYGGMIWWHAHEMLFGFAAAIIVGFLLTAVQTWTNIPGIKSWSLFVLVLVWLSGRITVLIPEAGIWAVFIDIAFLPMAALMLAFPILKIQQWRNLFFVPVLLLLTVANLISHLGLYPDANLPPQHGFYLAIILIMQLMMVMGGRVIPMFTANGTKTEKVLPIKWLEWSALGCGWLVVLAFVAGVYKHQEASAGMSVLLLLTALLHWLRCLRWQPWITVSVPLLWSLHLAYWFIPLGCLVLGLYFLDAQFQLVAALHVITVGAMGTMILAMIARVSLGHSGRPLSPHPMMSSAFMAVILAAIVRFAGSAIWLEALEYSWWISAILWAYGFGVFAVIYFPVLTRPRADGRPG